MGRIDLSQYLAARSSEHIHSSIGPNSRFRGGLYQYYENSLSLPEHLRASFLDQGASVRITIDKNDGSLEDITKRLREVKFGVNDKYRDVVDSVRLDTSEGSLSVVVSLKHYSNSAERSNNRDKIFYAVYNMALKPILGAL